MAEAFGRHPYNRNGSRPVRRSDAHDDDLLTSPAIEAVCDRRAGFSLDSGRMPEVASLMNTRA